MIGKQGNSWHVSKGGRQTERRSAQSTQHRRLLLSWLAVLIVATAAPAWAFAAPSNEDPSGGSSLAGITSNPSQDVAGASPNGDGFSTAWFIDPGEWFVASPASMASTSGWNEAAGSYSALRLAAKGAVPEVASAPSFNAAAGSYGELRLAAIESGASRATASLEESAWLAALSDACAEPSDDPVFGASSQAEAEFYDSQCTVKAAAFQMGGGGTHKQ